MSQRGHTGARPADSGAGPPRWPGHQVLEPCPPSSQRGAAPAPGSDCMLSALREAAALRSLPPPVSRDFIPIWRRVRNA